MLVISVLRGGDLSAPLKFSAVDSTGERLVSRLSLSQLLGNDIKLWREMIGIEDNPGDQLSVRYLVHFDHSNTIYVYRAITTFAYLNNTEVSFPRSYIRRQSRSIVPLLGLFQSGYSFPNEKESTCVRG